MRKILYVANAASIHNRRWAEYYRDRGAIVHVATFNSAEIAGVEVHRLPTFGLGRVGYLLAIPSLHALVRRIQPDIVHAQYVTSYGFLAALCGLHPLVVTAWGSDILVSPRESRLGRWAARYTLHHADVVTTVAEHMNSAIADLGDPAVPAHTIPFGVDSREFVLGDQPRHGGSTLRLICTRNFDPIYDIGTLVSSVERVWSEGQDFSVDFVGHGPMRAKLEGQVAQCGLAAMCRFHGHVEQSRLVELLGQADVFVSPALSDGNNVSLNEAMACGCFPIATAIPANLQWIDHGVNGLLYAPGNAEALADCIRRAFGDVALRARARLVNRELVEQRASWRTCVRRMDEIYEDAIRRYGAAG